MPFKKVNFQLVSPYLQLETRDFELDFAGRNMPADILPNTVVEDTGGDATHALVDGEWLMLSGETGKLTRAFGGTFALPDETKPVSMPCFPLYAERGRSELMAISKVPVIWLGSFEVDTHMINFATEFASGVGKRVVVKGGVTPGIKGGTAMSSTVCFSLLDLQVYTAAGAKLADDGHTVGFVTRSPASNGGRGARVYCSLGLGL